MKKLFLLLMAGGMFAGAYSQTEPIEPCCAVIIKNSKTNKVIARDNVSGRLYQFTPAGDVVNVNDKVGISGGKISLIKNTMKTYAVVQPDYGEPCCNVVNIQPDPLEPCCAIVTYKNSNTGATFRFRAPKNITGTMNNGGPVYSEPIDTYTLTGPVNIKSKIHGAEPCCAVVSIKPDPAEPCCNVVTYKNNITGAVSKISMNKNAGPVSTGDPLYSEPINDIAIIQSAYGNNGQMASYGYPATSTEEPVGENTTDQWVITPASMKGVLGRLNMHFAADAIWSIDVKTAANNFITNRSKASGQKHHDLAPGVYNFRLNTIMVENVPIEKGKETRLKAGYLNIISEGGWNLYDGSQKKFQTSGNKPQKLVLPVGNYQLKLGGQFFPVVIEDGKTVEM